MIAAAEESDRAKESRNRATLKWAGLVALTIFYLVILPAYFAESRYVLRVITTASVLSLISLGVWLTFTIGRINIGQGAFALIGGYTTAILATKLGLSFWICLPLSGLLAGSAGIFSMVSKAFRTAAALFGPTPGTPGRLSTLSPTRPR